MKSNNTTFNDTGIYELLFASIQEGIVIVDKLGKIVRCNPRVNELFGYQPGELLNEPIEVLIPSAVRQKHVGLRDEYQKAPRKRSMGAGMNLQAQRKDGSLFFVEISLNHIQVENEVFVTALITDITLRVQQENQIKELNADLENKVNERTQEVIESQALYKSIARNFPNGTINVFDKNLNYIFVEGKELFQLGITSEKLIGTSYLERLSEEIRPEIKSVLSEVFNGNSCDHDLDYKGQIYKLTGVPLSIKNNQVDKILVVEQNITAQKLASQQLEDALQKEKSLNQMKSRFVSMASHEFRTPLSTILSSVSLIEKYIENSSYDKTEKHIKRIKNSVKGLTDILNDFLSVDKLENQKTEIKPVYVLYSNFVKEMVEDMQNICQDGQKIVASVSNELGQICVDINILRNILYNLLSNAIKYSQENQPIIFESTLSFDELIIRIQDYGIGIPEHEQKMLFNRFFRANNAINIKGTGLGLNIVKSYLDMLQGNITFNSEENKGTTFVVKIPLNQHTPDDEKNSTY